MTRNRLCSFIIYHHKTIITMNNRIFTIIFCLLCGLTLSVHAGSAEPVYTAPQERLTPEQFRAKQQAYITEKAQLTPDEAAKFFPVYFELQDRKKQINDEAWKLMREGRGKDGKELSEQRYEEILEGMYDARISCDRLDKTYFERFKKILSCKKIFQVQRAEMKFHRELVKGMKGAKKGKK